MLERQLFCISCKCSFLDIFVSPLISTNLKKLSFCSFYCLLFKVWLILAVHTFWECYFVPSLLYFMAKILRGFSMKYLKSMWYHHFRHHFARPVLQNIIMNMLIRGIYNCHFVLEILTSYAVLVIAYSLVSMTKHITNWNLFSFLVNLALIINIIVI